MNSLRMLALLSLALLGAGVLEAQDLPKAGLYRGAAILTQQLAVPAPPFGTKDLTHKTTSKATARVTPDGYLTVFGTPDGSFWVHGRLDFDTLGNCILHWNGEEIPVRRLSAKRLAFEVDVSPGESFDFGGPMADYVRRIAYTLTRVSD